MRDERIWEAVPWSLFKQARFFVSRPKIPVETWWYRSCCSLIRVHENKALRDPVWHPQLTKTISNAQHMHPLNRSLHVSNISTYLSFFHLYANLEKKRWSMLGIYQTGHRLQAGNFTCFLWQRQTWNINLNSNYKGFPTMLHRSKTFSNDFSIP